MLRVGIAGIGTIAEVYIQQFMKGNIPGGIITALSSRNTAHLEEVQQRYHLSDAALFSDYSAMLKSGLVDVVMICTPHRLHPQMAIEAIEAGVDPLLEKPVGSDAAEVTRLLAALKAHPERKAGVLYCHRTNALYQLVKSLVEAGVIGTLKRVTWLDTGWYRTPAYHASGSWRGSWSGEGGGLLINQASHHLDLLCWLCGTPAEVTAMCEFGKERSISVETDVTLHLRYPNGALGQFIASSREFPGSNRLELSGTGGQIIVEDDAHVKLRRLAVDEREFARTSTSFFGPIDFTEEPFDFPPYDNSVKQAAIVADFLRAVQLDGRPLCPVEDALVSLQLINAAYLSAWTGQSVPFPPKDGLFTRALEDHCRQEG